MKNAIQKMGKVLSGMVMPNIGAFIAWGFLTAIFLSPGGWFPNKNIVSIQPFMLHFLIPVLIAYTGGKMMGGDRGGVMGAISIMGCVAGVATYDTGGGIIVGQPMLMGAMIMGPVAGILIKKFDEAMDGHMPAGFEMLINNFSVGIFGMILAIIGYYLIGPFMTAILTVLSAGVDVLVNNHLLPLAAIFIEPAKVLFLNNAINHGIFTPIGLEQATELGKSIMYMLEPNPGPGLGLLLAYMFFCPDKTTKDSAPGAIIVQFLGGIHEIYFPYILMNPAVIIGPIAGNICAILFSSIFDLGLVSTASPGSIIAFLSMAPKGQTLLVLIDVVIAAGVSFLVSSPIVKMAGTKGSLEEAQAANAAAKAASKGQTAAVANSAPKKADEIKKIVFACDAGMGSSAMGATKFRNRIKAERPDVTVINTSVDNIPADCDVAVVQTILVDRAIQSAPQAQMVTIGNFLADPALDALYKQVTSVAGDAAPAAEETAPAAEAAPANEKILVEEGIKTGLKSVSKVEAIKAAGKLLNELGYVDEEYIPAMVKRDEIASVYMGLGIAIPHGTTDAKNKVKKSGIVVLQYPDGVDFDGEKAQLVIGIAGVGDEHIAILGKITEALDDEKLLETLKTTDDVNMILKTFK